MEGETVHVLFETIPECHCGAAFNGFREAHDHITTETIARLSADRERLAVLALEAVDELEGWVRSELEGTSYFRENMDAIEARRKAIADLRGEGR